MSEKTGIIYTYLYNGIYLLLYMCYTNPLSFIELLMKSGIYDESFVTVLKTKGYYILKCQNLVKFWHFKTPPLPPA